jgi:hypothetical protein
LSNGCYVEVSEKEIVNVTEEIFAVGDVGKWDFILVNLAGKRSISYYVAEVINDSYEYEYEIGCIQVLLPATTHNIFCSYTFQLHVVAIVREPYYTDMCSVWCVNGW